MPQVQYQISIGSSIYTSQENGHLLDLRSHSSLSVPVNTCRMVLGIQPHCKLRTKTLSLLN